MTLISVPILLLNQIPELLVNDLLNSGIVPSMIYELFPEYKVHQFVLGTTNGFIVFTGILELVVLIIAIITD